MSDRPEPQQLAQPTYLRVHTYNHLTPAHHLLDTSTPNTSPTACCPEQALPPPRLVHESGLGSSRGRERWG
ncbi:hypothetical protein GCM10009804_31650 [Kribbella hippodromi]|uniref:Uncharacterized protein n=1 Tax=Kribbella hippodromi TaxID=434347 RepID=A0ABP4P325_9ACTN